jgi:ribosome biogenesis GTPase
VGRSSGGRATVAPDPDDGPAPSLTLRELGWRADFEEQVTDAERVYVPARVAGVWRRSIDVLFQGGDAELHLGGRWFQGAPGARPTVGDWVLLDRDRNAVIRLLDRTSLLQRRAAGRTHVLQPMAANVDVLFVVTACNEEFNVARLERYLALALAAGVQPVLVLTKSDVAEHPAEFADAAAGLMANVPVELVDARDAATLAGVRAWCGVGRTVALFGSSGVGKSTLVNSLAGRDVQRIGAARDTDAKGRHTTTHRSLHVLPAGGMLLDSPGMRELTLADVEAGLTALFSDIVEFAAQCRFGDCRHEAEPDCAVQAAIASGALDPRRLASFRKLQAADAAGPGTPPEPRPSGAWSPSRRQPGARKSRVARKP